MAMGEYLQKKGVKSLYLMAPNYAAGKDMMAGVKRTFKGEIKGDDWVLATSLISNGAPHVSV